MRRARFVLVFKGFASALRYGLQRVCSGFAIGLRCVLDVPMRDTCEHGTHSALVFLPQTGPATPVSDVSIPLPPIVVFEVWGPHRIENFARPSKRFGRNPYSYVPSPRAVWDPFRASCLTQDAPSTRVPEESIPDSPKVCSTGGPPTRFLTQALLSHFPRNPGE